jgi:DHA2 family lincomycin resistance protein-like MFS transporter
VLVNALPQLMGPLRSDERAAQWLSTGFMLTLAVVIPTPGWLIRRIGTRAAFRLAMALFVPDPSGARPHLDAVSVLLTAVGFGSLVYGLAEAGGEGGASGSAPLLPAPVALAVGALGLGLFVWRQLVRQRGGEPLPDLRVLRHRQDAVALALTSVACMALMGVMILVPLYLQQVRSLSVLETSLLLMPGGLTMGLMGPRVGQWFDRVSARPLALPGELLLLLSLGGLIAATLLGAWWTFLACHVGASVGPALRFTPAFTRGLGSLPPHLYPFDSAGPAQALGGGVRAALVVVVALAVVVVVLSTLVRGGPAASVGGAASAGAPAEDSASEDGIPLPR